MVISRLAPNGSVVSEHEKRRTTQELRQEPEQVVRTTDHLHGIMDKHQALGEVNEHSKHIPLSTSPWLLQSEEIHIHNV